MQFDIQSISNDPWIASSLLQKSIRRGDVDVAVAAASSFIAQRSNAIWQKLIIIACEDIGLGDLELVSKVIRLSLTPHLRLEAGGDHHVALTLCAELAKAIKDRSTDYLWISSSKHPGWRDIRETIGTLSISKTINVACDPSEPFQRRAVAAWYASGLNGKSSALRDGDLVGLFEGLKSCGVPDELADLLQLAAKKSRKPLIVMLGVLWHMLQNDLGEASQREHPTSPSRFDERIPLYALDKHTRVGKRAISSFIRECPDVARVLAEHIPAFRARSVGCLAVFYAEGVWVKKRLEWSQSHTLEIICAEADLLNAGCPLSGVKPIVEAVRSNLDHLDAIRRRMFDKAYPVVIADRVLEEVQP